jgi:predicted dehydrogenase
MKTSKYIGLIDCSSKEKKFHLDSISTGNGFELKKVLVRGDKTATFAASQYPHAEIVENEHSIFHDSAIDLVIVSAPENEDLGLVAKALEAGKQVRVV